MVQEEACVSEQPACIEQAAPLASSRHQKLLAELAYSKDLIAEFEQWMPQLKQKLDALGAQDDPLPRVSSFFAVWSLDLLQGIFLLVQSKMYSSALLLLRSLIEAHMELTFILDRDCSLRAAEYLNAGKENRTPYRDQPGFEAFGSIGKRANRCGLGELYHKTYLSLCSYSHLRIKGSLAAGPDSERIVNEARACLIVGQAMLIKISRQICKTFHFTIPLELARKYSGGLNRYHILIQRQEKALAGRVPQATAV